MYVRTVINTTTVITLAATVTACSVRETNARSGEIELHKKCLLYLMLTSPSHCPERYIVSLDNTLSRSTIYSCDLHGKQ